ncbi:hypothetical protein B0T11DRAFT_326125 [Plectosphaerella cucumerina]|uniref:Uncharacterized protein n=1 Tax=Plectosphaerella cucumerina TaxID=40658 RepID=A0A8K0TRE1_9PEZI|nr:hypothetical protein B0T11DRAFT_326125 [Plectosphaerella cucumerina]
MAGSSTVEAAADRAATAIDLDSHWTTPSSYKRIRISTRDEIETTYPLIAAYVKDPTLALTIDEMVVDPDAWPGRWKGCSFFPGSELDEPPKPVDEEAHAAIEKYVRALGLGNATTDAMIAVLRWKKDHLLGLRPETPDSFDRQNQKYAGMATVVLLSLARNIKTLHMGRMLDHVMEDYFLHNNHGRLPTLSLQKLETLHHVALQPRDERYYNDLDPISHLRCFHRLPALESFSMDAVIQEQDTLRFSYPSRTGSLKHLHITRVDISSTVLAAMIRLPRTLESFTLSMGGFYSTDGGSSMMYLKTLGKALREHKMTLRVLDLDLGDSGTGNNPEEEGGGPDDDDDEEEDDEADYMDEWYQLDLADSSGPRWTYELPNGNDGPFGMGIGSLKSFTALRHLSIDPHTLLGWKQQVYTYEAGMEPYYRDVFDPPFRLIDALPQGLEVLKLRGYTPKKDATVDGNIRELMRLKGERLPNLRLVEGVGEETEVETDLSSHTADGEPWQQPNKNLNWVRDEL